MITAPYNFVPLSAWIFSPDWAERVSHDMPFRDGISGRIDIKITAETPILIGHEHKNNEVHFCQINGYYAIPGTTLKGMIRNVLEIASFGKMNYVDDRRLGIRDISSKRVREKNYLIEGQKAGFLRLRQEGQGEAEIVPCQFVHIEHPDMSKMAGFIDNSYPFREGWSVKKKYEKWQSYAKSTLSQRNLPLIQFDIDKSRTAETAINLGAGQIQGEIVFTGQISDKNKTPKTGKYRDFVFYKPQENDALAVLPPVLADFRFIHGEHEKKHEGSWPQYWKEKFFKGESIPVFYHLDHHQQVKSIGLAFMYKLAYDYSIGGTIAHTHPDHLNDDIPDLAEVMLGKVHPDPQKNHLNLKSRVSFGACFVEQENIQPSQNGYTTVLSGPKPTYFPNYIRQDKTPELDKNKENSAYHYRTYMQYDSEIRGWKRYPVRQNNEVNISPPPRQFGRTEREINLSVQSKLFPLPAQTTFSGSIRFHNLRPEELGALLWVLEWGGDSRLRHNIGMGKPLGFGVIKLEVHGGELRFNSDFSKRVSLTLEQRKGYYQQFEQLMDEQYQEAQQQLHVPRIHWKKSEQLILLRAMAWPEHGKSTSLRYMLMGNINEFNQAKQNGWVLPEYQALADDQSDRRLFPRHNQPLPAQVTEDAHTSVAGQSPVEAWLEAQIGKAPKKNEDERYQWENKLTGKLLAKQWQELEEGEFKQQLRDHLEEQWRGCGDSDVDWWERPLTNSMRQARKIYGLKKN